MGFAPGLLVSVQDWIPEQVWIHCPGFSPAPFGHSFGMGCISLDNCLECIYYNNCNHHLGSRVSALLAAQHNFQANSNNRSTSSNLSSMLPRRKGRSGKGSAAEADRAALVEAQAAEEAAAHERALQAMQEEHAQRRSRDRAAPSVPPGPPQPPQPALVAPSSSSPDQAAAAKREERAVAIQARKKRHE